MSDENLAITDNHIDSNFKQWSEREMASWMELRCDCDAWVKFAVGGPDVEVACDECGQRWQVRGVKVDE